MDRAGQITPKSISNGAGVIQSSTEHAHNTSTAASLHSDHAPQTSSALQVSDSSTAVPESAQPVSRNPSSPGSPTAFHPYSGPPPQSPSSESPSPGQRIGSPKSPSERMDEFLKQEDPRAFRSSPGEEVAHLRDASHSPSKVQSYSPLRNVSSPLPDRTLASSSPPSPRSTISPPLVGSSLRPEGRQAPRTSSIDSAISSMSLSTTHSPKGSLDSSTTSSTEVSNLIRTAGSAEALIHHLIKEKLQVESQNAQLWTLVEKQRKLVLGLNNDLERAARDRERFRKQLNSLQSNASRNPDSPSVAPAPASQRTAARSPAPSETFTDLPIQRQSLDAERKEGDTLALRPSRAEVTRNGIDQTSGAADESGDWVKSKATPPGIHHAHKQTSSSDLGAFNLSRPAQQMPLLQTQNIDQVQRGTETLHSVQTSPTGMQGISPTSSFTAKRSQPFSAKPFNGPSLVLTESTPPGNDLEKMTPPRKAPPAPLDLGAQRIASFGQTRPATGEHSASEYEDDPPTDQAVLSRGRKTTREADDRERVILQQRQNEERSQSLKKKNSKSRSGSKKSKISNDGSSPLRQALPMPPSIKALAPEPSPALGNSFSAQPASLVGMLSPGNVPRSNEVKEQMAVAKPPMSPGLPSSPRPIDRPMNAPAPRLPRDAMHAAVAPPLSPRPGFVGLPLSPRAPRQQIPLPLNSTPSSTSHTSAIPPALGDPTEPTLDHQTEPSQTLADSHAAGHQVAPGDSKTRDQSQGFTSKEVVQRFVSEAYPGLLIPPNALPSIKMSVVSSRLKPSRYSLVLKGADEEPVFTLGISARSDGQDLWQVEKPIHSLQQLDQQLRQTCRMDHKLPDRGLFNGHAPAKVDARRAALERYLDATLDTQLDEKAAVALCQYLSSNVLEPGRGESNRGGFPASPAKQSSFSRHGKTGYLTKRGKNFGGWKARFFVLEEPLLKYYESSGGAVLGTIRLHGSEIGRQSPPKPLGSTEEGDGQYRHAFIIREPKRKDPSSSTDHILCAESDSERDLWVAALIRYTDHPESQVKAGSSLRKSETAASKTAPSLRKNPSKQDNVNKVGPDNEQAQGLQSVPYEETQAAQPPQVHIMPEARADESPSPTTPNSHQSERAPSVLSKPISGPQNGAKISDAGAWGNKPMASPLPVQREAKKRSLFNFHNKEANHLGTYHPNGSDLSLTQQQYQEQITNVKAAFGAPLAEAVEHCGPKDAHDTCLPAVVFRCLQYLEAKHASAEEGLFRLSGSNTLIKNLRHKFNAEGDFDLLASGHYYDVHAVASLLKQYLRELPSTVLTKELHMQFLQVLGMSSSCIHPHTWAKTDTEAEVRDVQGKKAAFNSLVHKLPQPNYRLLKALSAFLVSVVTNSEINKMDIRNVSIVFSPTLNIPTPVIDMFVTEFDGIFGAPMEESDVPSLPSSASQALTADDIRSPRRQMFSDIPTPAYNQTSFAQNQSRPTENTISDRLHGQQEMGFAPLQPAYNNPEPTYHASTERADSVTLPGPEYAIARPRNLAPGNLAKQSRRESSMLLM